MRAFVITSPNNSGVQEVTEPTAGENQVVVDVSRVGICGTDQEFFTGEMVYLHSNDEKYPVQIGHEWSGVVTAIGKGVNEKWLGQRVTGDTMLGCQKCYRCLSGRQHLCHDRYEIGVRRGWPGACAEKLLVPETALYALPDSINDAVGALVEPAGNALRAVEASLAGPGKEILIYGTGTIGLLAALLAQAAGANVHLVGRNDRTIALAHKIGIKNTSTEVLKPRNGFDGVIDATNHKSIPHNAVQAVEPGGRVVYIGISGEPSLVDSRDIALKDVTAVGILSASPGLKGAIEIFSRGEVDPTPLIAATVSLEQVHDVFMGIRPYGAGDGPKIHIDPRLTLRRQE